MAKSNKTAPAAINATFIRGLGFRIGRASAEAIEQLKAAGKSAARQSEVRDHFMIGYIASRLNLNATEYADSMAANAARVLNAAIHGGTGKLKDGQSRRTEIEQRAFKAASAALSRLKLNAGIATVTKRGGKRNGAGKKAKAGALTIEPGARVKAAAPEVKTVQHVPNVMRDYGAMMMTFIAKNKGLEGDIWTRTCELVAKFNEDVAKLGIDANKAK